MTMTLLSRRSALAAVSALMLAACGGSDNGSTTGVAAITKGDHVKGSENAPVTIIEYASPTCPACRYFHDDILPELTEKYVNTGKVKFVFREYPIHEPDVPAYVLAMCAGEDKFFDVLDDLFANQVGVVTAAQNGTLKGALQTIGKRHGIETTAQFDACMENREYRTALADKYQVATEKWGVDSTPTFIVNGEKHLFQGETSSADAFSKYIDRLLGETAPAETEAAAPAEDAAPQPTAAGDDAGVPETTDQP
ncbi:thioredoxin domain-containing protein [Hyphomonas jannaschiana]|uniref:DSBA-like thioredoxin domain-containing protein n=1 Tax=Hyphomonas jannaschiana VP2 TaxID=1280952 RepID=A0A059FGA8_9PROT|nr:thioredoxin domain-containing protein [Hyphomonas jannaschiana]KCZ89647.1 DSBA-like thioredoxin domain-containing protein [Hyphomonas jannaschiana VP2]